MTDHNLTCAELDERLGDYLEHTLDDSTVAAIELHLSGCPSCRAMVRDFEGLVESAASLPALEPSRDLWPTIASRIEAPVAMIGAHAAARRPASSGATPSSASWRRLRTGAMAAGLVGVTAFGTYLLTNRAQGPASSLAAGAVAPAAGADVAESPVTLPPMAPAAPSTSSDLAGVVAPSRPAAAGEGVLRGTPSSPLVPVGNTPRLAARETFSSEITALRGIVSERRDELDPRTIAILEASIATIDSAIAEARRALEVDPGSRFLSSQLNKSLEKKLGLLRTAVLLPSRT